ncbi:nitroreductase family deazaflavin-dependent oxidoreductase [Nocardia sp. NPDC051030]|uniref:nitroreductase family deazaflavin-dependent oxidoreductase n=1 Tax=Nocardia sp. NPDC051030 TaxID=3155162 RepID=UPI00341D67EA
MTNVERQRLNQEIIAEFRSGAGKVGGQFAQTPILLLTTTGARTGETRTWPLAYQRDGDNLYVFAANGGRPTRPGWFHNLVANPAVTVEVGTESWPAKATVATGEERERLWNQGLPAAPFLTTFQEKVSWPIPVVVLTRADGA